jgi:hypothetical protein
VSLDNDVIVQLKFVVVQECTGDPPEVAVYADVVYPVIADPPLDNGAAHVTKVEVGPGFTVTLSGVEGVVSGTAAREFEFVLVPIPFTARKRIEYVVPLVSPVIVNGSLNVPAFDHVPPLFIE